MKKINISKKNAFSLIEIMVGILIVSLVSISGFQALSAIGIGKIKLIEKTEIEKQAYFASEKFFEIIKKGGTLDYEEYWNRESYFTGYLSGHYDQHSGFGNFGNNGNPGAGGVVNYGWNHYNCVSSPILIVGTGGCLTGLNVSQSLTNYDVNYSGEPQRYTQYERQFIDRNSDGDLDLTYRGDEDNDGDILGDDDDLYLGEGPEAFSGSRVGELYLISPDGSQRTYFRWNVTADPNDPDYIAATDSTPNCDFSDPRNPSGSGCLGTIEFLKLVGEDYGYNHLSGDSDAGENDGIIDTWLIHPDFVPDNSSIIAGSNTEKYWQRIFPDSLNVSDVSFYAYPSKDMNHAWRTSEEKYQIAPYVQIKMTLSPSWKQKKKIQGVPPSVDFVTTVSLTDLNFR